MTARLPLLCLLPLALTLVGCGGSSGDDPPTDTGGTAPPEEPGPQEPGPIEPPPEGPGPVEPPPEGPGPIEPPPSEPGTQGDANPFQTPDPQGATVLERRGYANAVEEADGLVSTRYLDPYRAIAEQLPLLAEGAELGIEPMPMPCPGGGTAQLSRPDGALEDNQDALRYQFSSCVMESLTLDGQLEQRLTNGRSRFNTQKGVDSRFDALALSLPDGTRIQLDGTTEDNETDTFLLTCGPVPAIVLSRDVALSAVTIESPGDGTTRLSDVAYRADDEDVFEDRGTCDREQRVSFAGSTTAALASEPGGEVTARLIKSGVLVRDDDENPPVGGQATLTAEANDGSSLSVTATDDAAGLAQYDLRAGSAVVSFVDAYTFQP